MKIIDMAVEDIKVGMKVKGLFGRIGTIAEIKGCETIIHWTAHQGRTIYDTIFCGNNCEWEII